MVDNLDDREDLLESTSSRRSSRAVVVLLIAVAAGVVGLLSWPGPSPTAGEPRSAPLHSPKASSGLPAFGPHATAPAAAARPLWVFFEPLDQCTSTDHYRRLRIALAVTNLSDQPLRLLGATAVGLGPDLRLNRVQFGSRPCAARTSRTPVKVSSSGAVMALNLAVGPGCPSEGGIDVRVTFAVRGSRVHADTLVSLSRLRFLECASR